MCFNIPDSSPRKRNHHSQLCDDYIATAMSDRRWVLLLHQIPPKPAYFRARVLRRLEQVGALPVKNSAYLLPDGDETLEDFAWICREIRDRGGAAWLFRAEALAGMTADQIEDAFRELRAPEYEEMLTQGRLLSQQISEGSDEALIAWRKLLRRDQDVRKIDFFHSPARRMWDELMTITQKNIERIGSSSRDSEQMARGRTWVTRRGVKVDRIASAWLIQRFIDPDAAFRFVDPKDYSHDSTEIRFDMFDGEFTHEGDLCTFEVLLPAHGLSSDVALAAVAEIVHDIDLKKARYERPETAGLAKMIDGLCLQTQSDQLRLKWGATLFESLYLSFQ
jgi:hypothetical protein